MRLGTRVALAGALFWLTLPVVLFGIPQENSCRQRTVLVGALSRDGQIIGHLSPSQFIASYRGKPVRIASLTQDNGPRRVFIVLDASGSMQPVRKFSFNVAEELLNGLPDGTQVGFTVFATRTTGIPILTPDRKAVRKQLEVLRNEPDLKKEIKGLTALLKAMQEGVRTFGEAQSGDSLYVISDGEDNASNLDWRKLEDQLIERGTRVFAMGIQWVGGGAPPPEEHGNPLHDIVTSTGGAAVVLPLDRTEYSQHSYDEPLRDARGKPTKRAWELGLQAHLITNYSKMVIELPETLKKRDWQLKFAQPDVAKDRVLIYPHSLPPCSSSADGNRSQ